MKKFLLLFLVTICLGCNYHNNDKIIAEVNKSAITIIKTNEVWCYTRNEADAIRKNITFSTGYENGCYYVESNNTWRVWYIKGN